MVSAYIEQVLMWLVIFVGFVTFLFFVIDYSNVMRIKGNMDLMTEYAANMVALGKTDDEIVERINDMKSGYFADAVVGSGLCTTDSTPSSAEEYQIIFTITGSYLDTKVLNPVNSIVTRRVVFNDISSDKIDCSLTINPK